MNWKKRIPHFVPVAAGLVLGGMILVLASASFARVEGNVLVNLEAPIPVNCSIRIGYVDYNLSEMPPEKLEFAWLPFSMFQEQLLLAFANREGLLIDLVGAAEAKAFESFLEDLRQDEKSKQSLADLEFGRRKPLESEEYENYDLRALIDEEVWRACDYEIAIEMSDWESEWISNQVHLTGQYWTFDTRVERADVKINLVELESGQTIFSVHYAVSGDDMKEVFGEAATDYSILFEITVWRQWIKHNLKTGVPGSGN